MDELWYEKEDFSTDEDIMVSDYNITSSPNDFNIKTIFQFIEEGIVKLPPFQRNYVWDIKRASKLIESIIIGLPIPQIFLYEEKKNQFLVIDGQQRLLSIFFFMKQRFPTDAGRRKLRDVLTSEESLSDDFFADDRYFTDFKLRLPSVVKTEKNPFNGLKYLTLGDHKNTFEFLRTIRCIVIKQNEPENDKSSIFEIFNRLNSGGQNLLPQEIRMSLFYSKFYDKLIELNHLTKWREILNSDELDIHFKDIEIILRGFALLVHNGEYTSPMNKFLNSFSRESMSFSDETIAYFVDIFKAFLSACEGLEKTSFATKSGKFAISVFDAIFVAACEKSFKSRTVNIPKIPCEAIVELKANTDFIKATQDSVASKASVDKRIAVAKEILQKYEQCD